MVSIVLSKTTHQLFPSFPREIGKYRGIANSRDDFEKFVHSADGKEEVYTAVYDETKVLDKVTIDFDKNGALSDARKVNLWAQRENFPVVPAISGKKGFHIHIFTQHIRVKNPKEVLTDITFKILQESLGIKKLDDKTSVDHTVVGNPNALIRIPNTLRLEHNAYCSYLPPNWTTLSEYDIWKYSKSPHDFNYNLTPTRSLLEIIDNPADLLLSSENVSVVPANHEFFGDYKYIEKLLLHPVADGRHRIVRFILAPYFANVLGLDWEEGGRIIKSWLDAASTLKSTSYGSSMRYDYQYAKAHGFSPWTLRTLEHKDTDLYSVIVGAVGK